MKVFHKYILVLVIIAIIPTAVAMTVAVGISQRAIQSTSDSLRRQSVAGAAAFIDRSLREVIRTMSQGMTYADLYSLDADQQEGALTILYLQLETFTIISLIDSDGNGVTPSIYRTFHRSDDPRFANHEPVAIEDHAIYQKNIPIERARRGETGVSRVYTNSTGGQRMAFCLAIPQSPSGLRWFLAAEISLGEIQDYLQVTAPTPGALFLYDADGQVVLGTPDVKNLHRISTLERVPGGVVRFDVNGEKQRGSEARIALAGWGVILHQPESVATRPARAIRDQALLFILVGLLVAVGLGWVLARDQVGPLRLLAAGARSIAAGETGQRVDVESRDEFGELAQSFNQMAVEIQKRQEEIEAWGQELKMRVEERTRELRDMERVAARAQRLASLAAMGAGVAHEINNPLCTILGTIQLARKRYPDHPMIDFIKAAESDAERIGDIVKKFLEMTQPDVGEMLWRSVDICWLLDDLMDAKTSIIAASGIRVEKRYGHVRPVRGEETSLRQVLIHLLDNAIEAMPQGGCLELEVDESCEGAVRLRISDTGAGIEPENQERIFDPFFSTKGTKHQGLGLSVAFRIIEDHQGSISVESTPRQGTLVEIILPLSIQETRLA